MGNLIPLPTSAVANDGVVGGDALSDFGRQHRSRYNLRGWRPEQLWLSQVARMDAMIGEMAGAVAEALQSDLVAGSMAPAKRALLHRLRRSGANAGALRLAARMLRGPCAQATPLGRDLAAAALWVAVWRHDDLLAAVEFAAEVAGRAIVLEEAGEVLLGPLPPAIHSNRGLAGRMRQRARDVLAHRLSWPDLDTIGPCLARALAEDPIATLGPDRLLCSDRDGADWYAPPHPDRRSWSRELAS